VNNRDKSTVPKTCIKFAGTEEREQNGWYEYKTKHKPRSARNSTRKTGREENIHIQHRLIETGKQTRNRLGGDRGYYWYSAKVGNSHSGHVHLTSCMECFQLSDAAFLPKHSSCFSWAQYSNIPHIRHLCKSRCHDFGGALPKRYNRRSWRMDCCLSPFC